MIYKFKTGFHVKGCDPQKVGEELERIRKSGNRLLPDDVVRAASNPKSPLHSAFEWDDKTAAIHFRHSQATYLIRSVVVVQSDAAEPQRAFYNVTVVNPETSESERYYQSSDVIASSPVEYAAALGLMIKELSGAEAGLRQLQQLAPKGQKMKVRRAVAQVGDAHRTLQSVSP